MVLPPPPLPWIRQCSYIHSVFIRSIPALNGMPTLNLTTLNLTNLTIAVRHLRLPDHPLPLPHLHSLCRRPGRPPILPGLSRLVMTCLIVINYPQCAAGRLFRWLADRTGALIINNRPSVQLGALVCRRETAGCC